MTRVTIIDYGMCNLDSIARAVEECGGIADGTDRPEDMAEATHIILPGVGAFPDAMQNIRERSLDKALRKQAVGNGIPLLGICLGMQLLATKGWEGGETEGLGLIQGEVCRLQSAAGDTRVPHVGWNEVTYSPDAVLFQGVPSGKDFYFVHSYHLRCDNEQDVLARTPYCGGFVSAVQHNTILGVQFHPEKSQRLGLALIANFLRWRP